MFFYFYYILCFFIIYRLHFFSFFFFFFNDTATTEIYTLSLHDALPISRREPRGRVERWPCRRDGERSEEHTSELQSRRDLVCRLLLEKKKKIHNNNQLRKKKNTKENQNKQTYDMN